MYDEDLDHLPQAKAAIDGLLKETQTSLKALSDLLDLARKAEDTAQRLPEQLNSRGCIDLLREHQRLLEKLIFDLG